jgi:hypothetical protein
LNLTKFTICYLIYVAAIAGVAYLLSSFFPDVFVLAKKFWVVLGFLSGITFIAYAVAYLGIRRHPETGVMAIMASIAVKMIFSMAFVLIYSLNNKENAVVFVLNFFSLYLLFSFFEIYCLLRNLRHQIKK